MLARIIDVTVEGRGGIDAVDELGCDVDVQYDDGSSFVRLVTVDPATNGRTVVHLDYRGAARLIAAVAASMHHM